jgi:hypothetical protein
MPPSASFDRVARFLRFLPVGKPTCSYAEVVRGTRGTMVSQPKKVRLPSTELNAVNVRDNSVSLQSPHTLQQI